MPCINLRLIICDNACVSSKLLTIGNGSLKDSRAASACGLLCRQPQLLADIYYAFVDARRSYIRLALHRTLAAFASFVLVAAYRGINRIARQQVYIE